MKSPDFNELGNSNPTSETVFTIFTLHYASSVRPYGGLNKIAFWSLFFLGVQGRKLNRRK